MVYLLFIDLVTYTMSMVKVQLDAIKIPLDHCLL